MEFSDIAGLSFSLTYNFFVFGIFILFVVSKWFLFKKAGEPGWASLIPYYNMYVYYKIAGKAKLFWVMLVSSLLSGAMYFVLIFSCIFGIGFSLASSINGYSVSELGTALIVVAVICALIFIACMISMLVVSILANVGLAKSFGQSGGFAVGLIFLPFIFVPIMAFSNSIQYRK